MVRRASRLPPNGKSLEEVVLHRIASGAAAPSSGTSERRKPSLTSTSTATPGRSAGPPSSSRTTSTVVASPDHGASGATLERIEAMASELSQLNARLMSVATSPPSGTQRKRSARPRDDMEPRSQIDQFIAKTSQDVYAAYATHKAAERGLPAAGAPHDPARGAQVTHAVRELRSTVRRLDKVFYDVATGDKQRHLAATRLATLARGFLARRRFRRMRFALGSWRARKCGVLLTYLEQFSAREEFLARQIARLDHERERALLRRVVAEIRDVALLNLPLRLRRLEETERRFRDKQRALVREVWAAWKRSALGPRSRKRATADAKARHAAARRRLEALERFDVITTEMTHDEFLKDNIRVVRARHPSWVLKTYFAVLLHGEYLPMKLKRARAVAYERKKLLALVWRAWRIVIRAAQADRAAARSVHDARRTLDRFEQHHNLRKIDAHYRATHVRKHLRAWGVYAQRIRRVRKLFEDTTKDHLAQLLRRWRVRASYQRSLRDHAVESWRAYGRRIFQTPFRAWYSFAAARRADRRAKESICVAYQRRARRHTKYAFFRLWKHQVLFGSVEGIHSKVQLLRSLEDQKRLCLGLEEHAALRERNAQALQQTITGLEAQLASKQLELLALHEATQATRFSVHSAEQSIARVQGMLEAARQLHPGSLARIEKMFAENPLLTQDLREVVALHVARRREVLDKLALDGDELEIQQSSSGFRSGGALSREDQLLLHRVKWVLSRLDLGSGVGGVAATADGARQDALDQLCALFEFIRDGETAALSKDNDPSHPRDDASKNPLDFSASRPVERADLLGVSETWHAFRRALTVRFASERMLQVQERLVRRAEEMGEQLQELKANRHIYNAYSSSAQPHGDETRAATQNEDADR